MTKTKTGRQSQGHRRLGRPGPRWGRGDHPEPQDLGRGALDVARFPKLDLVSIEDFGGWKKVQPEHFGDGGIFDQIYAAK